MNLEYLPFEQEIAQIEDAIIALKNNTTEDSAVIAHQIEQFELQKRLCTETLYAHLTVWQSVQVARHPKRPYTLDYIPLIFTEFQELHGDRHVLDDGAIVGGLARFKEKTVMVIGHQKGRTTQEKIARNFGMPRPEGYRKALRLMQLAAKFGFPVITFIDTAGAYPGIDAEARNQSEAIAKNIQTMACLPVPIIAIVTGEGSSGGAIALGVADCMAMLQYSIYCVITPEGCASILWKDAGRAAQAAEAMGVTTAHIADLNILDAILPEPLGGAHRDPQDMANRLRVFIDQQLTVLMAIPTSELLAKRQEKLLKF
jgi:acetyl-CoA carboxylase carboxyl transferase subunit alpha